MIENDVYVNMNNIISIHVNETNVQIVLNDFDECISIDNKNISTQLKTYIAQL